jgi:predicted phage terminase large subunit-like protein
MNWTRLEYLLEHDPGVWTHLSIPLEAEKDEYWTFPISGKIIQRECGGVLMSARFPESTIEELKRRRLTWAGQYQQRPAPIEGNIIRRSEVSYYGGINPATGQPDEKLPTSFDRKLISVDCSFKDTATADFVAILVVGAKGRKRFVINAVNRHLDAAATEAEIRRQRDMHGYVCAVLVEDKANGPAVVQRLKLNVPGVIAINPEGGKTARMFAASPEWQAGDWYVDRNAAWTEPFIEQITMFPNAGHDDMADAMSQCACWLMQVRIPRFTVTEVLL